MDGWVGDVDAPRGATRWRGTDAEAWLRLLPAAGPPAETYVRRPRGSRVQ